MLPKGCMGGNGLKSEFGDWWMGERVNCETATNGHSTHCTQRAQHFLLGSCGGFSRRLLGDGPSMLTRSNDVGRRCKRAAMLCRHDLF